MPLPPAHLTAHTTSPSSFIRAGVSPIAIARHERHDACVAALAAAGATQAATNMGTRARVLVMTYINLCDTEPNPGERAFVEAVHNFLLSRGHTSASSRENLQKVCSMQSINELKPSQRGFRASEVRPAVCIRLHTLALTHAAQALLAYPHMFDVENTSCGCLVCAKAGDLKLRC